MNDQNGMAHIINVIKPMEKVIMLKGVLKCQ